MTSSDLQPTASRSAEATRPAGAAVEVDDVTKTYRLGDGSRLTAIDHTTLTVDAGTSLAVLGPSGSGKSTLLHLIGAIDRPDTGTITVAGTHITRLNRRQLADYRAGIGFVFQQFHLLPALTALDNVLAPVLPRKVSFDKHARATELLQAVGLGDRTDALPSRLSGGQQQRVAIARALINQPSLLLADEPTGNLDTTTGREILDLLDHLRRTHGSTLIIATHDLSLADRCERTITVRDGKITT